MPPRPKTYKKKYQIAIDPKAMDEMKALAVQHGKPVGEVIEGLVDFAASARFVSDETYIKRFNGMLETCLVNAGQRGGFIPENVSDEMTLEYIRRKTREDLEAKKRELEEELRKLESE